MITLDDNTKATLDAGEVVLLDGGYLVMTPETMKMLAEVAAQAATDAATEAFREVFGDLSQWS